jgi:predicted  nucleic acid-binding Zn-ribbon protein
VAAVSKAADDAVARVKTDVAHVVEKFVNVAKTIEKVNESVLKSVESLNAGHQKIGDAHLSEYKEKMKIIHEKVEKLIDKMADDEQQRNQQIVNAMTEWVTYNEYLSKVHNEMKQLPRLIGSAVAGKG